MFQSERIVRHPDFNINYDFDVAVIKTVEMLIEANNFIQPIALGMQGTISEAGSLGNVTGWGLTEVKKDDRLQGLFVKTKIDIYFLCYHQSAIEQVLVYRLNIVIL